MLVVVFVLILSQVASLLERHGYHIPPPPQGDTENPGDSILQRFVVDSFGFLAVLWALCVVPARVLTGDTIRLVCSVVYTGADFLAHLLLAERLAVDTCKELLDHTTRHGG